MEWDLETWEVAWEEVTFQIAAVFKICCLKQTKYKIEFSGLQPF